ncbi:hypothetical protein MHYP_G00351140 [Metynnis hypsauchen]
MTAVTFEAPLSIIIQCCSTLPSVPRYSMDLFCFLWFGRHGNPLRPANRKQARKLAESAVTIWNFWELQQYI